MDNQALDEATVTGVSRSLKTVFRSYIQTAVEKTLTVTEAKAILGKLVDDALKSKAVFIRRGSRVVQLVPAAMPDPIPVIPEGGLTMTEERVAFINSMPADPRPLIR